MSSVYWVIVDAIKLLTASTELDGTCEEVGKQPVSERPEIDCC